MKEIISYCGLKCNECDAYIATKTNDDKKREETAKLWSQHYKADLKPEDINCEGCLSTGEIVFSHCKVCKVRECCRGKSLQNCAYCPDYACETLEQYFKMAPQMKQTLDEIWSRFKT